MNDNKEQTKGRENTDKTQSCCDGGSCCSSASGGQAGRWKMVVFILILIAAGVVLARSFLRKSNSEAVQSQQAFASVQAINMSDSTSQPAPVAKAETPVESENKTEVPPAVSEATLGKSNSEAAQSQQSLASVQTVNMSDSPSLPTPVVKAETPVESENKTEIPPAVSETTLGKSNSEAVQSQQSLASVQTVNMSGSPSVPAPAVKAETPVKSENKTEIPPAVHETTLGKSNSEAVQSQQASAPVQTVNMSSNPSVPAPAVKAETPVKSENKTEIPPAADKTTGQEASAKNVPVLWRADLDSLDSLEKVAADTDLVFVLLAAENQQTNQNIISQIDAAAQAISKDGILISAFKLKKTSPDYAQLAKQYSVPSVLAMVKWRGVSAVSGKITKSKLVQAYVKASRPVSGCCPSGAGSSGCK